MVVRNMLLHIDCLEQFVQLLKTWQLLYRNLHEERIVVINTMIVDDEVHDIASPGSIERMVGSGAINKSLIEFNCAIEFLCDVGRPQFGEMVEDESSDGEDSRVRCVGIASKSFLQFEGLD